MARKQSTNNDALKRVTSFVVILASFTASMIAVIDFISGHIG